MSYSLKYDLHLTPLLDMFFKSILDAPNAIHLGILKIFVGESEVFEIICLLIEFLESFFHGLQTFLRFGMCTILASPDHIPAWALNILQGLCQVPVEHNMKPDEFLAHLRNFRL